DDAVLLRAERLDRTLGGEVEIVGAKPDHLAGERLERVAEEEQLADGVEVRLLPAFRVPRVADLEALGFLHNVVIARRANEGAALELAYHEGQHVRGVLPRERLRDIALRLLRARHGGEPQLPQRAIGRRGGERVAMLARERLESHAVAFERDG